MEPSKPAPSKTSQRQTAEGVRERDWSKLIILAFGAGFLIMNPLGGLSSQAHAGQTVTLPQDCSSPVSGTLTEDDDDNVGGGDNDDTLVFPWSPGAKVTLIVQRSTGTGNDYKFRIDDWNTDGSWTYVFDPAGSLGVDGNVPVTGLTVVASNTDATGSGTKEWRLRNRSNTDGQVLSYSATCELPTPAFSAVKASVDTSYSAVGDTLDYTITVTNTGNVTLTGLAISDPLTSDEVCPVTSLAPGAQTICTASYTVTQNDIDLGKVDNIASVDTNETASQDTETVTINAVQTKTLTATKASVDTSYSKIGDTLDYTITLTNTGNVTLTGLTISDSLTSDEACPVTSLAPGAQSICTASYTVTQEDIDVGKVDNTASIGTNETDPQNTNTVTITAAQTKTLTAVKASVDTSYNAVDDTLDYTITVTNTGNVTLTGLTISDPLTSDESCPVASLAPGAQSVCTASYTITQNDINAGKVDNTASVDTNETDPQNTNQVTITAAQTKALTAVKASADTGYTAVGDTLDYTITVTNTGNVTLTGLTINDPLTSDEACPATILDPGAETICTASYTVTQSDIKSGQVDNIASVDANEINPQDTNPVSIFYSGLPVDDLVRDEFESLTYNFVAQRLNLIASNTPHLSWKVNRVANESGAKSNGFNVTGENGTVVGDFAFSSAALRNAVSGDGIVPASAGAQDGSGVHFWIEGQFALYNDAREDENAEGDFFVGYAGVDVAVTDAIHIGIMGQLDWMSENGEDDARVEGTGWMVGPYLSAEIASNLFLDVRAMGGQSDNSIRQSVIGIDYDGDFQTDRWLAEAALSGNYAFDALTVTPDLKVLYMREDYSAYDVDSALDSVEIGGNAVTLAQLSGGLRASHLIVTEMMLLRPYAAGRLFWNIDNPGELTVDGEYVSTEDFRGAVTLGIDASAAGMQFGLEGTYDGLFADNDTAIGGQLSFGYQF